jgi:hypothetical protein
MTKNRRLTFGALVTVIGFASVLLFGPSYAQQPAADVALAK